MEHFLEYIKNRRIVQHIGWFGGYLEKVTIPSKLI
jgi:hypothetical protein